MAAAGDGSVGSVSDEQWSHQHVHAVISDCFSENWQRVVNALDAGFPVNAKDRGSFSLVHGAARSGNMPVLRRLLAAGADVDTHSGSLMTTPAHFAAMPSCADGMVALVEAGADMNARDIFRETPLHHAVCSSLPCTRYLLSLPQVDLSATNINGMTAEDLGRSIGALVAAEAVRAEVRAALGR